MMQEKNTLIVLKLIMEDTVYKENVVFPNTFHIYKQPKNENPWYIGYGMDDYKGYNRNLDTIHKL